jgi:hypothetical protein
MLQPNGNIAIQYREGKSKHSNDYKKDYITMLKLTDFEIQALMQQAKFEILELKKFPKPSTTYKWVFARKV